MKQLVLIRHAKSSWKHEGLSDIYRPLSQRGYNETELLSGWFLANEIVPDRILTSPAVRTYTTALTIAVTCGLPVEIIVLCEALYETDPETYLNQVVSLDAAFETVLLVGHNDTISQLLNRYEEPGSPLLETGTGALLCFDTESWSAIPRLRPSVRRIL